MHNIYLIKLAKDSHPEWDAQRSQDQGREFGRFFGPEERSMVCALRLGSRSKVRPNSLLLLCPRWASVSGKRTSRQVELKTIF